jgi:hypothetical protein
VYLGRSRISEEIGELTPKCRLRRRPHHGAKLIGHRCPFRLRGPRQAGLASYPVRSGRRHSDSGQTDEDNRKSSSAKNLSRPNLDRRRACDRPRLSSSQCAPDLSSTLSHRTRRHRDRTASPSAYPTEHIDDLLPWRWTLAAQSQERRQAWTFHQEHRLDPGPSPISPKCVPRTSRASRPI